MAGSIVMEPLGERKMANFGKLIGEAGDLNVMGKPYPRVQILSTRRFWKASGSPRQQCSGG